MDSNALRRKRLAFYATNVLFIFFLVALGYVFLVLGNSIIEGAGGDVIHYDLQGRPYTTKINGVSEGAWTVLLLFIVFTAAKILAVAFILDRITKWFPGLERSLYRDKITRYSFSEILDERTSGADAGAMLLAFLSLCVGTIYAIAAYNPPLRALTRDSLFFWFLNSCDVITVSSFLFSFFTLRRSRKSIIAFFITLAVAVFTNQYAIRRTWQWVMSGMPVLDTIPLYILTAVAASLVLFIIGTVRKNSRAMPAVCVVLSVLLYVYYKLLYGYDWLSFETAYKTGVLAGPVAMTWLTIQLKNKINIKKKPL